MWLFSRARQAWLQARPSLLAGCTDVIAALLFTPEPGHVSGNGRSLTGRMAQVSVRNPKLALMDDDIMAAQGHTTNFIAVGNTYQGYHMLWVAFTWGCRHENIYGRSSCICVYLIAFCSYPLLNYRFYYLLSVYGTLSASKICPYVFGSAHIN